VRVKLCLLTSRCACDTMPSDTKTNNTPHAFRVRVNHPEQISDAPAKLCRLKARMGIIEAINSWHNDHKGGSGDLGFSSALR
jgi:hypothetical protein